MHVIRLRGPWELRPLVRYEHASGAWREVVDDLPAGGKTRVPGDWAHLLGADFLGRVRYTRRFNTPTNLDANERVWLVVERVAGQATVFLNDHALGAMQGGRPHRVDITALLSSHNLLAIDVDRQPRDQDAAGGVGGVTGEVRLEIGAK